MIELVKLYLAKPLNALVIVLCVSAMYLHKGQAFAREEIAVIKVQQKHAAKSDELVLGMIATIARMDANLEQVKNIQAEAAKTRRIQ